MNNIFIYKMLVEIGINKNIYIQFFIIMGIISQF